MFLFFFRKDKYRNTNEMLNDKSEIKKSWDIYKRYSLVADEYDDEYDDTYDSHDIRGSAPDDSTEIDARPFITPRVIKFLYLNSFTKFYFLCNKFIS